MSKKIDEFHWPYSIENLDLVLQPFVAAIEKLAMSVENHTEAVYRLRETLDATDELL